MARYDISQIKSLATGRWPEILGLDGSTLDGQHHLAQNAAGVIAFALSMIFIHQARSSATSASARKNGDGIATLLLAERAFVSRCNCSGCRLSWDHSKIITAREKNNKGRITLITFIHQKGC